MGCPGLYYAFREVGTEVRIDRADDQIEHGRKIVQPGGRGMACAIRSPERRWNDHMNAGAGLRTWLGVRRCSRTDESTGS